MRELISRVLIPAALASGLCMGVCALLAGRNGLVSSAVGAIVVAAFFLSSLAVLGSTKHISAIGTMAIALALYGVKAIVFVALMAALLQPDGWGAGLDRGALAGTMVALALVWTTLEIRASAKARQPLYDLNGQD